VNRVMHFFSALLVAFIGVAVVSSAKVYGIPNKAVYREISANKGGNTGTLRPLLAWVRVFFITIFTNRKHID
jgi:hypothetical protein